MRLLDALHRLAYRLGYPLARLWWRLRRPQARGATVALWVGDGLLVLRTSYRRHLDLPGGGLRPGETPRDGAVRELREEVGILLAPGRLEELAVLAFTEDHRQIVDTLLGCRLDVAPPLRIDRREVVWAGFRRPAELAHEPLGPVLRAALGHRPR